MELVGFSTSNKVKNHRCIGCINYVLQCPIELSEFVAFSYIQGKPSNMAEGGLNCIKYLLFGFNLMFFLCGAGILGVGIWLRVEKGDYVSFTDYEFATASSLAIAAGAVIVIVTFFGVVGSIKENRVLLLMFFVSLLLIFCLEISAGGLAYANRGKIETEVKKDLNVTIHEKYGKEEGTTKAIDKMQEYFKCCGNAMYQDWRYSQYYLDNKYKYPPSCCMKSKRTDTCGGDTKNLNQRGCYEEVKNFLLEHLLIIGIVGIVFGLIQILGMILSMCLYCGISKQGTYA